MELKGKVFKICEAKGGVSNKTGNAWYMQDFVIEWLEGEHVKHANLTIVGEDKAKKFNLKEGETITASFDVNAREYQGRYYNSLNVWKVEREKAEEAQPATKAAEVKPTPQPTAAPAEIEPMEEGSQPF